ncbi:MAG: Maf family protein [Chloroflexota bacterium]
MVQLILASQSPRRRQLIKLLEHPVHTTTAAVDEESVTHPDPACNAVETARLKARAVAPSFGNRIIVAADTIVALDGEILGKPEHAQQARATLRRLRGCVHQVHTGLVLIDTASGRELASACTTRVTMRDYSNEEIEAYIASGDPFDKAGAYAIQHTTFDPVDHIKGCYANVVGLPLCRLKSALEEFGVKSALDVDAQSANYERCTICLKLLSSDI